MASFDFSDEVESRGGGYHMPARGSGGPKPAPKAATAKRMPAAKPFVREYTGKSLADYYHKSHPMDGADGGEDIPAAAIERAPSGGTFIGAAPPPSEGADAGGAPDYSALAGMVGYDTEAAKILRQLYGRPKLSAPVPKPAMKSWQPASDWQRPMQAPDALDPREGHVDKEAQALLEATRPPAVAVKEVHVPAIELAPHRKSAAQIEAEKQAALLRADITCPPMKRGYNTDAEKRKLQAIFSFKGGKALPDSGLPQALPGHLPLHVLTGKRSAQAKRRAPNVGVSDVAQQYRLGDRDAALLAAARPDELRLFSESHATAQELSAGIAECRAYIEEMSKLGALPADKRTSLEAEIIFKQNELSRIGRLVRSAREAIAARLASADDDAAAATTIHGAADAGTRPVSGRPLLQAGRDAMYSSSAAEGGVPRGPSAGSRVTRHPEAPGRGVRSSHTLASSPIRSPGKPSLR